MPKDRDYKPGDVAVFNGSPYRAGADGLWYPQTSLAGQVAQGATDLPVGLVGLANMLANKMPSGVPGGKSPDVDFTTPVRNMYDSALTRLGVNVTPPQTRGQRFARAAGQIPGQAMAGLATGGTSLGAELAGATGGALAAQTMQEAGGEGVAQFGAGAVGDLISRRPPMRTVSLVKDLGHDIYNAKNIAAFKLIQPLDLADEGAAKVLSEIHVQHAARKTAMDSAYSNVRKLSKYPVSGAKLRSAADAMLSEVKGNKGSQLFARTIYDIVMQTLATGKGSIDLDSLRYLQKEANALLDTADPTRTGLAQQQGQVRHMVIPAIQQTLDDIVAAGTTAAKPGSSFGPGARAQAISAQQDVDNLRKANAIASEYYTLFDKRSEVTKAMVEGIQGGSMLDARKALTKVFSDPKEAVNHARAIMQIIGVNPRNEAVMRKALVESVVGENLDTFSASKALTDLRKIKPAAVEILGDAGYNQFEKFLEVSKKHQVRGMSGGASAALGFPIGAMAGHLAGVSPWMTGTLGSFIGFSAAKTLKYVDGHFGEGAAHHLAAEAITDPKVFALLHANPRRIGQPELQRAISRALIRSGFRSAANRQHRQMLPSDEQYQQRPSEADLERFRRSSQ